MQLGVGRFCAGFVAVEPSVDVDARPLAADQLHTCDAPQSGGVEGGSQRTQHPGQHRVSLRAEDCQRTMRVAGRARLRTLSHGDGDSPGELSRKLHMQPWAMDGIKARRAGRRRRDQAETSDLTGNVWVVEVEGQQENEKD